jgi:hypothetical protein
MQNEAPTIASLRNHRADAEKHFQAKFAEIEAAFAGVLRAASEAVHEGDQDLITTTQNLFTIAASAARGYHREVCAAYAAELSLISSGTMPTN